MLPNKPTHSSIIVSMKPSVLWQSNRVSWSSVSVIFFLHVHIFGLVFGWGVSLLQKKKIRNMVLYTVCTWILSCCGSYFSLRTTLSLCFLGLILPSRGRGGGENAQLCKLTYLQGKESYGCLGNLAVVVDVGWYFFPLGCLGEEIKKSSVK